MTRVNTIIIGGGQAGLAMSRCLTEDGVDHVVFERGRVGEAWRSERWDSLRLLTPNWRSRLPGWSYAGPDPDGFMTMTEFVDYLEGYARSFVAPLRDETSVLSVEPLDRGYRVLTNQGEWRADNVVVATGACGTPFVPEMAADLDGSINQLVPTRYRNPDQLVPGGVLVVGASASGLQIADELRRAGREVTLSVGTHTRLPRTYRGKDIMWWLDRLGVLDEELRDGYDGSHQPSLQLVGRPDHRTLDLATLQRDGVQLAGRTIGAAGHRVTFADSLRASVDKADTKLARTLERIDDHIDRRGMAGTVGEREDIAPVSTKAAPTELDLRAAGIRNVLWATGFRGNYPWLKVPVLDERGDIIQHHGITPADGLYTLGLRFQCRRSSSHIDGVGLDARQLSDHITASLRA